MQKAIIRVKRDGGDVPEYAKSGDAGFDLRSKEDVVVPPSTPVLIRTGLFLELPFGYELQIRPRSGLALKKGITVLNSPGTIDSGYRGEIGIILINHTASDYFVKKGDRVAQGVVAPVVQAIFEEVEELSGSERGAGGFGHTGEQ